MKPTRPLILTATLLLTASAAPAQTFVGTDLGNPMVKGSVVDNGGDLTITGGGGDIWNSSDQCYYYWAWASGWQWAAVVELTSLQGPDWWTKAELMVRWSDPNIGPQANDAFIAAMATQASGQNEIDDQFRSVRGQSADSVELNPIWHPTYPTQWMRLTRTNTVFRVWFGSDGVHWTNYINIDTASSAKVGNSTFGVAWPNAVTVGLAVAAHNNSYPNGAVAQFSNFQVLFPPIQPPTVIGAARQPQDATNYAGSEVSFTFVTTNDAVPNVITYPTYVTYQWYRNGGLIPGATSTNYTHLINPYDPTENGAQYYCQATILPPYNFIVSGLQSATAVQGVRPGAIMATNGLKVEFFSGAVRTDVENGNVGPATSLTLSSSFNLPQNWGDNYTRRVNGWFRPQTTTNYVLFIAGDDDSDLFLSTDANPANKQLIAQETFWSPPLQYGTNGSTYWGGSILSQKRSDLWTNAVGVAPFASGIPLTAGNLYYIEAVHHNGYGGDNLDVTYAFFDTNNVDSITYGPTNGAISLLQGTNLPANIVLITSPTTSLNWVVTPTNTAITEGYSGAFYAKAATDNELLPQYQWYKNGNPIAGATSTTLNTGILTPADNGAHFYVTAQTAEGGLAITSAVVTLTVASPVFEAGWAKVEFWQGKDAGAVEGGTAGAPTYTTTSPAFETSVNGESGDDYARRVSGYFVPPATDDYVFYVCSDDDSDLFVSTNSNPANKQLVAHEIGWADGSLKWLTANYLLGGYPATAPWVVSQTRSDQWTNNAGVSPWATGIHLLAGQQYYIEGVHHEGGYGDYFSATYKRLNTGTGSPGPDPLIGQDTRLRGGVLGMNAARCTYVAFTQQPTNLTVAPSATGTFTFYAKGSTDSQTPVGITGDPRPLVSSPEYCIYQWQKNGVDIPGATSSAFTYNGPILASDNGAQFTCKLRSLGYANNSLQPIWSNSPPATLAVSPAVPLVFEPGLISVEHWDGKSVNDVLSGNVGAPAWTTTTPAFEVSTNDESGDNYARRLSGFFIPAATGDYVFWIAADDNAVLNLSTDASPLTKRIVAHETSWASPFQWLGGSGVIALKRSDQFSDWVTGLATPNGVHLIAGQKYYMEAIHGELGSGDHVEVTYSLLGSTPADGDDSLLTGSQIGFLTAHSHVAFTQNPQNVTTTNLLPVSFSVAATTDSTVSFGTPSDPRNTLTNYLKYQWYKNNVAINGATTANLTIAEAQPSDNGAQIYCAIRSVGLGDDSGNAIWSNSQPATLTIISAPPAFLYSGIWTDYNPTNLGGSAVTYVDLTFNKHMDINTLLTTGNYVLGGSLSIVGVTVNSNDYRHVELAVAGTPTFPFSVAVNGFTDANGIALPPSDNTVSVQPVVPAFADIGTPGVDPLFPSSLWVDGPNAYTVVAEGHDIWDNADGFNFLYEAKTGDFDVVVRQKSISHTSKWAKGGLMMRESFSAGSRNWSIVNEPLADGIPCADGSGEGNNDVECTARISTDQGTASWAFSPGPVPAYPNAWVRLKRIGQGVSAYYSTNGVSWTLAASNYPPSIGDMTPLPSTIYVGLCTTSHKNNDAYLDPDPFWNTVEYADYNSSYDVLPAAATLHYTVVGSTIQISWTPAGGHLESSLALGQNAVWSEVTPVTNPITLPISGAAKFFRVVNP